jgi:transposase
MPKWGAKLPSPRQGGWWPGEWQEGEAFLYGRMRKVQWKEVICLWKPLGPGVEIKAVVAKVEGYTKRFTLMSTATELTGLQVVELFCGRFRQEDGFRDLKQRLGWEECRAWTRQPIEVTTQTLFVGMTLMRLLQFELEKKGEKGWWLCPPWNKKKDRPSVLDVERLLRKHGKEIQRLLSAWLEKEGNNGEETKGLGGE